MGKLFLPKPLSNLLLVVKVLRARCGSMPLCFVDNFPLKRLTLNICQTHPFLPSFCQLWLIEPSLNVFFFRVRQQISGLVESCNFGNLEDFVSEALFVRFFERYIFRSPNFAFWLQAWFSDKFTRLLRHLRNQVCYMLRRDLVRCQSCYAIDSRIECVNERLQFVYVAIRPFVLQMFVDDVFERSNIQLCKCRLRFTICGVSSMPLLSQNFLKAPVNSVPLSDHTFNSLVSVIMRPKVVAVSSAPLVRIG